eukprot:gene31478-38877_t
MIPFPGDRIMTVSGRKSINEPLDETHIARHGCNVPSGFDYGPSLYTGFDLNKYNPGRNGILHYHQSHGSLCYQHLKNMQQTTAFKPVPKTIIYESVPPFGVIPSAYNNDLGGLAVYANTADMMTDSNNTDNSYNSSSIINSNFSASAGGGRDTYYNIHKDAAQGLYPQFSYSYPTVPQVSSNNTWQNPSSSHPAPVSRNLPELRTQFSNSSYVSDTSTLTANTPQYGSQSGANSIRFSHSVSSTDYSYSSGGGGGGEEGSHGGGSSGDPSRYMLNRQDHFNFPSTTSISLDAVYKAKD